MILQVRIVLNPKPVACLARLVPVVSAETRSKSTLNPKPRNSPGMSELWERKPRNFGLLSDSTFPASVFCPGTESKALDLQGM